MAAIRQNMAAPTATSTLVRRPAIFWRHCRSMPMTVPTIKAAASRSISSEVVIREHLTGAAFNRTLILDSRVLCDQQLNERTKQRFALLSDIVNTLEKTEVKREFLALRHH